MDKIIQFIRQADKIAVLTHISEDSDALGSAAAFSEAMKCLGKTADVYISEKPEDRLSFLGEHFIIFEDELQNPEYDLCVCIDCADKKRLGSRIRIFENAAHTINIDHHFTNPHYAEENLVIGNASSSGEVLFGLLKRLEIKFTKEIAKCLYVAIVGDTGCFQYSNVSPKTLEIVAELLKLDIDHSTICRLMFASEKRTVMRYKGYLMENIIEYFDGRLCIVLSNEELLKQYGVDKKDIGDIVNIPRMVQGCEIAVSIREYHDQVKISFRSNGRYDVSGVALSFGGGGHKMAAGATVSDATAAQIVDRVVHACGEIIKSEEVPVSD